MEGLEGRRGAIGSALEENVSVVVESEIAERVGGSEIEGASPAAVSAEGGSADGESVKAMEGIVAGMKEEGLSEGV